MRIDVRVSPVVLKRVIRSTAAFWTPRSGKYHNHDPLPCATSERPVILDLIAEDNVFTRRSGHESKADR